MRKHQQKQIFELLQTIRQAQSKHLYADCQDGALAVGEFIESIEGEGTHTVALLEEYCELLFKANIGDIEEKQLNKHFIEIESSIKNELKVNKFEVAFLSYNASMSDSIKSIYFAAKEDSSCDAYWIPIPYYERNPDGTLSPLHCDSTDCYKGIECTDWCDYDIEVRHPEIIFTFYPYDKNNFITTVHPDFYCQRLCEITDMLVYVPYFVTLDDIQEHFCIVAGCVFSHKVILQSEKIRDIYIRVFKERYGNVFGKPEDKFVALGSPKFDAVISAMREAARLPSSWSELVRQKKVVLYNTSINELLKDNELYFKKLRCVIDTFRSRSDVVLWWRPHPLNEAAYKAMRPQLLKEYKDLIAEYKSGNFIYDDTPELHRAIACADGYLGDWSSLVPMFAVTGKPIMIQNTMYLSAEESRNPLLFEFCYDDGEHIWFAAYWFNGLCKCNKETGVSQYLGCFPGEKRNGVRLFMGVAEGGGKLYFAPLSAKQIAVYDMSSGEFGRIELKEVDVSSYDFYLSYHKFFYCISHANHVYLIPATYPAILRIDTNSHEVVYIDDWLKRGIELHLWKHWPIGIATGEFNSEIIVPFMSTDALLSIDCNTLTTRFIPLNTGHIGYFSMCFNGNDFWLARLCEKGAGANLVKWNRKSRKTEIIELNEYGKAAFDIEPINFFTKLYWSNGNIYALSQHCDMSFCLSSVDGIARPINIFSDDFIKKELADVSVIACNCYWMYEDVIYGLASKSRTVRCFDISSKPQRNIELLTDLRKANHSAIIKDSEECAELFDYIYYDNDLQGIEAFLDMIENEEHSAKNTEHQIELAENAYMLNAGASGKKIYKYLTDCLLK